MSRERPYDQSISTPTLPTLGPRPSGMSPPDGAVRGALAARRGMQTVVDRLAPADLVVWHLSTGIVHTKMLAAVARLRIADLLADRGPMTGAAIAEHTGQNADAMHRTLRALATSGVFALSAEGTFSNNFRSEALRSGRPGALREFIEYFGTRSNVDAWNDFDDVLRTGKNGFVSAHGKSVWDWFDEHPGERDLFAAAMMGITVQTAPIVASLYPWNEVKTLCDVGGGRGTLLSELLVRFPGLRGILYDGAGVVALAPALFAARGVEDRVSLESGSFFERVPGGADAYGLKNILHDWDDERSIAILRNVRAAMEPGRKVIVMESLVEPNDTSGMGALADAQMMVVCDEGRERSRADFGRLFEESGFTLARVFEHAMVSVIEGIAR